MHALTTTKKKIEDMRTAHNPTAKNCAAINCRHQDSYTESLVVSRGAATERLSRTSLSLEIFHPPPLLPALIFPPLLSTPCVPTAIINEHSEKQKHQQRVPHFFCLKIFVTLASSFIPHPSCTCFFAPTHPPPPPPPPPHPTTNLSQLANTSSSLPSCKPHFLEHAGPNVKAHDALQPSPASPPPSCLSTG